MLALIPTAERASRIPSGTDGHATSDGSGGLGLAGGAGNAKAEGEKLNGGGRWLENGLID